MSPNILTDYHNVAAFSLLKTPDRQVRFDLWACGLEDVFLMHKRPLFCAHFVGKLVNFFHCQPPAAFTHRHTPSCCHIHWLRGQWGTLFEADASCCRASLNAAHKGTNYISACVKLLSVVFDVWGLCPANTQLTDPWPVTGWLHRE